MSTTIDDNAVNLISFFQAEMILKQRFPDTTIGEFGMWALQGRKGVRSEDGRWHLREQDAGGITSFYDEDYEGAAISSGLTDGELIVSSLVGRMYSRHEIETFCPEQRWLPYSSLLQRWMERIGPARARALIEGSELLDAFHPVNGVSNSKHDAVFLLSQVVAIELSLFPKAEQVAHTAAILIREDSQATRPMNTPLPAHPNSLSEMSDKRSIHKLKTVRRDALDALIDEAILSLDSCDPGLVFRKLRDMALEEKGPFNGLVEKDNLFYIKPKGDVATFTYEACCRRLRRRRLKSE